MNNGFYISFADDEKFLGGVIVRRSTFVDALLTTWIEKTNPSGEAMGMEIEPNIVVRIPEQFIGRLLDRAACNQLDALMGEPE